MYTKSELIARIKHFLLQKKYYKLIDANISFEHYVANIQKASINMLHSKKVMMTTKKRPFVIRLKMIITKIIHQEYGKRNNDWYYGWNKGYLYAGLTEICLKDKHILASVKSQFDQQVCSQDGTPLFVFKSTYQTPFAHAAVNLHQLTGENKYKIFADSIYQKLKALENEKGLIKYAQFSQHDSEELHLVDEIGMYVPFLIKYYQAFGTEEALLLAKKNMDYWIKYGTDPNGMPHHYIVNDIPLGSNNWGRGLGWYILALVAMCSVDNNYEQDLIKLNQTVDKLCPTSCLYTQFIGLSHDIDSSSIIPIMYLKNKLLKIDKSVVLESLKKITSDKAQIIYCSGDTCGYSRYAENFTKSEFAQGFSLLLLASLNDYKRQ